MKRTTITPQTRSLDKIHPQDDDFLMQYVKNGALNKYKEFQVFWSLMYHLNVCRFWGTISEKQVKHILTPLVLYRMTTNLKKR